MGPVSARVPLEVVCRKVAGLKIAAVHCHNQMRDGVWGDKSRTWDKSHLYITILRIKYYYEYNLCGGCGAEREGECVTYFFLDLDDGAT